MPRSYHIGEIDMPVGNVKYARSEGGEFPVLQDGSYMATLEEAEEGEVSGYQGAPDYLAIKFRYRVNHEEASVLVFRDCRLSLNEKANLVKDLKGMVGKKALQDVMADDGKVTKLINNLIGQKFLVTVEQTTSQSGRKYNKFLSVSKLPEQGAPIGPKPGQEFEDDDIPF